MAWVTLCEDASLDEAVDAIANSLRGSSAPQPVAASVGNKYVYEGTCHICGKPIKDTEENLWWDSYGDDMSHKKCVEEEVIKAREAYESRKRNNNWKGLWGPHR
jgi:hypothetical protein